MVSLLVSGPSPSALGGVLEAHGWKVMKMMPPPGVCRAPEALRAAPSCLRAVPPWHLPGVSSRDLHSVAPASWSLCPTITCPTHVGLL